MDINIECLDGHKQVLHISSSAPAELVDSLAQLLDGSSAYYLASPTPETIIGKCAICQQPFSCTVKEAA